MSTKTTSINTIYPKFKRCQTYVKPPCKPCLCIMSNKKYYVNPFIRGSYHKTVCSYRFHTVFGLRCTVVRGMIAPQWWTQSNDTDTDTTTGWCIWTMRAVVRGAVCTSRHGHDTGWWMMIVRIMVTVAVVVAVVYVLLAPYADVLMDAARTFAVVAVQ